MTMPNVSVLHGGDPAPAPGPSVEGAVHLHLSGPVQVHVHLGHPPQAAAQAVATNPRRFPFALALLGLALAGGGYLAGVRHPASPANADLAGLPSAAMLPPMPEAPLPALPQRAGELPPPALQQQLARVPVVTPPPGGAPAPGRNPFGLGN